MDKGGRKTGNKREGKGWGSEGEGRGGGRGSKSVEGWGGEERGDIGRVGGRRGVEGRGSDA